MLCLCHSFRTHCELTNVSSFSPSVYTSIVSISTPQREREPFTTSLEETRFYTNVVTDTKPMDIMIPWGGGGEEVGIKTKCAIQTFKATEWPAHYRTVLTQHYSVMFSSNHGEPGSSVLCLCFNKLLQRLATNGQCVLECYSLCRDGDFCWFATDFEVLGANQAKHPVFAIYLCIGEK